MSSAPHPGDESAGYIGLIIGAICVFIILYTIVRLTHAHYAGEAEGAKTSMLMLRHAVSLLA